MGEFAKNHEIHRYDCQCPDKISPDHLQSLIQECQIVGHLPQLEEGERWNETRKRKMCQKEEEKKAEKWKHRM
jgi:hypothetical protein